MPTVWDVRTIPLDRRMLADARAPPLVITAEDGIAEGGVGAAIVAALGRDGERPAPAPRRSRSALRSAFVPQGKPADLLANLGLDGPGIAATVLKAPRRRQLSRPDTNRRQPARNSTPS